jgi:hypothetical protein
VLGNGRWDVMHDVIRTWCKHPEAEEMLDISPNRGDKSVRLACAGQAWLCPYRMGALIQD